MVKHDPVKFNAEWHETHRESKLHLWVCVSQKFGTRAILEETFDYMLPTEERLRWGTFRSDSTDGSSEAKWAAAEAVLMMRASRMARAAELGIEPF